MAVWFSIVRVPPRHRRKKTPPHNPHKSARYITDAMMAPYLPNILPTSRIELTISCRNLVKTHILGKTDPYCIVSIRKPWDDKYTEVARTEVIDNTQNPQWLKKIKVEYYFEAKQYVRFEIHDRNAKHSEFVGRHKTQLSELVANCGREYVRKLFHKRLDGANVVHGGELIVVAEEVSFSKQIAGIEFSAENLPKPSLFRKCSPFLIVSRQNDDGSFSIVAKTEPVKSTQNPSWPPMAIPARALCNGDFERNIKIDCYDHRKNGSHKLIATTYTTLNKLNTAFECEGSLKLINEEKQKTLSYYVPTGVLRIKNNKFAEEITFLDYIRNGTQMHFAVAIDFTASNKDYTDPKSLHYLQENYMNNYELALRGVGEIVQQYDSNRFFPAFGFGAKIPPYGDVSFQFPLNDDLAHPSCSDVEDILKHYRSQLKKVQLYGPTNFAPVINNTIAIAKEFQDGKHYFVLLIITDGVISDMHLTKLAIIEASALPISVIIVGVGDADFQAMDELDSDGSRLTVDNRVAERDVVQFVPLKKFLATNGSHIKSQADLAEEVLAEIPEQLNSYMKSRGFKPY